MDEGMVWRDFAGSHGRCRGKSRHSHSLKRHKGLLEYWHEVPRFASSSDTALAPTDVGLDAEDKLYTYSIITTDSNKQLSFLHDRYVTLRPTCHNDKLITIAWGHV